MKKAIVVSELHETYRAIKTCLGNSCEVKHLQDKQEALAWVRNHRCDFAFIDYQYLEGARWVLEFKAQFRPFWHACHGLEIILLIEPELIRGAVYAVIGGAYNYLTYPLNPDELTFVMDSFVEQKQIRLELDFLRDELSQKDTNTLALVASKAMQEVIKNARKVAPTESTVLITGETGSGKTVLARLIHKYSSRKDRPFMSIHCSAIPETLLESELFGHEKGAFTGAVKRKLGKFEAASGGTIFLDEIGTLPLAIQVKLLQVLQERTFTRLGAEDLVETDIRIIAATNANLSQLIDQGLFRSDLFYRLNVFPITVPPLRHRKEDLPLLVEAFIHRLNDQYFKEIRHAHPDVMRAFEHYPWPGNIRELENLVERAYILEQSSVLQPASFPQELFSSSKSGNRFKVDPKKTLKEVRDTAISEVESLYLRKLLRQHQGRINASAEAAGITTRQLHKLLARYQIDKRDFKPNLVKHTRPPVEMPRITAENKNS